MTGVGDVFWVFDACHMLKLIRNLLHDYDTITICQPDGSVGFVRWSYIAALHHLQSTDSLNLANKLGSRHINYRRAVTKVKLASQTLSRSVATAIDFLRDEIKMPQFRGSESTTQFILRIDSLFDVLNSRHPLGRHLKAPLSTGNRHLWAPFLEETYLYLSMLRDKNGMLLLNMQM